MSHSSIAGSRVTASASCSNEPSAWRRSSAFWRSISVCGGPPALLVANQSCQTSVMRSTSGASVRTMRSSHQQWSWPQASRGASGRPSSSTGAGPVRRFDRGLHERVDRAVEPALGQPLGLPGPRAEAGAPQQAARLVGPERAAVLGDAGHPPVVGR